jgi:drug/metabolite transporter (DMT)-like permease
LVVPILGIFFKKRCGVNVWIGVLLTLVGLYLLCIKEGFFLEFGDVLVMSSALAFSVQILLVDYFSPKVNGVKMACIQFFTCGFIGLIPTIFIEIGNTTTGLNLWLEDMTNLSAWIPILYAGVLSCGVAYTLQIVGQVGINPTIAALIMSLESVFAVLAGWILLGQDMSTKEVIGCVLIFSAIIFAQIPIKKFMPNKHR